MVRKRTLLHLGIVVFMAAGCTSSRQGLKTQPVYPPVFEQEIYPFAVLNEEGAPLEHPFYGGFNLPRPQFVDIDGDGDPDLFVQEVTGHIKYFENTGSPQAPKFVWRSDHYGGLDVGEWYRFFDLDSDGDFDLLGETRYSYIRLFRNEGTPTVPAFRTAIDSLRDAQGIPLFADRQNIPSLTDLDCDDLLDLFIGRVDGTVLRYESVGTDDQGLPQFELVTRRFEDIEIVNQFVSLHGANALTFHDVEGDGDPDLFWGDFFEPGVLLIPNTGTCAAPNLRNQPIPFPLLDPVETSGYNAPLFTDLDGDGDQDFFLGVLGGAFNPIRTAADNFYHYEYTDNGLDLRSQAFITGIDVGAETYPAFADLDGDGDQDLLLANKITTFDFDTGQVHYFENLSEEGEVTFQHRGPMEFEGHFHFAPALGDLDADGDLDMLLGTWNKGMMLMSNEGTPENPDFVQVDGMTVTLTRGSNSAPALVDIDGDADLDLFAGESSGDLNFYRNTGTPTEPKFELVSDKFGGIDAGRRSVPRFADLDGDGDQDLLLGREYDGVAIYLNVGSPREPSFEESGTLAIPAPIYAAPALVDIDMDGDLDLFSGGLGGGLLFFRNTQ